MTMRNSTTRWGSVARFFHWVIAALILALLIVGFMMEDVTPGSKRLFYTMHKSMGLLVLALVVCRLVWRMGSIVPAPLATMPRWQVVLAEAVHWGLYGVMLLLPVSGYLMTSYGNHPFDLFMVHGLSVPLLGEENKGLAQNFGMMHGALSSLLVGLLALHIGAAFYHHFIAKDAILARMTPLVSGSSGRKKDAEKSVP